MVSNLHKGFEVVNGSRPPFEKLQRPDDLSSNELSEDETENDDRGQSSSLPRTELEYRLFSIADILSDLNKLSLKIINLRLRSKPLIEATKLPIRKEKERTREEDST